jgi:hypothetical protein
MCSRLVFSELASVTRRTLTPPSPSDAVSMQLDAARSYAASVYLNLRLAGNIATG